MLFRSELADCFARAEKWREAAQAMQSGLDSLQEIASHRALRADEEQARRDGLAKLAEWSIIPQF